MKVDILNTFETLYADQSDALFRFCALRVSDRHQALDIVQETFLRLWQTLQQGKKVENGRAFLFTVAHRLIIDWYRKKKSMSLDRIMNRTDGTHYDIADESVIGKVEIGAEGRYLVEKLNELPESYRLAMYLRFVEELSPMEIGAVLGISANAASVRVRRGILELRKRAGYEERDFIQTTKLQ